MDHTYMYTRYWKWIIFSHLYYFSITNVSVHLYVNKEINTNLQWQLDVLNCGLISG